ncbi:MAG: RIP metalloprotease RseP, partial [bacterium]
MGAFGYSLFGFLVAIAILVAVHEYGHFWVARKLGVKVLRFSIGFGRPIVRWRRAGDPTEYCIGAIPLGGYVKMLDQADDAVAPEERAMAFDRQSLAARSAIVFAGPAFNFLFAIFAIWLVLVAGSDGIEPRVGAVAENSVAQRAGFRADDRLVRVDGRAVQTWGEHQFYLLHQAMRAEAVEFEVAGADGDARRLRVDFAEIDQYALGSAPVTAQIGLWPPPPEATVWRVVEGSPADLAGLRVGDRILAVAGAPVADWGEMVREVASRPGERVALRVARDGDEIEINATLGVVGAVEAPDADGARGARGPRGRLGLHRPPLERARLRHGLLAALPASLDYNLRMTVVTLRSLG